MQNFREVRDHWNGDDVESMYDKHLLDAEIRLISRRLREGAKILDAGCGEGEGTWAYSAIPGTTIHAVDFSDTRLKKAADRLGERRNVSLRKGDFLGECELDKDYDFVISQRFLINLMEWDLQKRVLLNLINMLKPGGLLLMLEGSQQGVDSLNSFRKIWGLEPIPVKWHNLFFDDACLEGFMAEHGYRLVERAGLGTYFVLTRGIRPTLDGNLDWNCTFNRTAASEAVADSLGFGTQYSRLKLWVFAK